MKTNRPTNQRSSEGWYDLGYEDAALDAKEKQSAHYEYYMNLFDVGSTRTSTDYDKGWMKARDDMEGVLEIVHCCIENGRPEFGQLIIENYINCKVKTNVT